MKYRTIISVTTHHGTGPQFRSRPQVCTEAEVEQMKQVLTNVDLATPNFKLDDEQLAVFPKHTLLNSVIRLITTPVEE